VAPGGKASTTQAKWEWVTSNAGSPSPKSNTNRWWPNQGSSKVMAMLSAQSATVAYADTDQTSQQRFARGMEVLRKIRGEGFDVPIKRLAEISPDLARFTVEYPYGDVISQQGLDLRLRQITTVSALMAQGNSQPQNNTPSLSSSRSGGTA
jgi:alkylhydroperoxidase/carboxymuconolactone decarboxylase family protein YurZ